MTAIIKKELRTYLFTVSGALFIGVNLLFSGIYFTGYNLSAGFPSISYTLSSSIVLFLFVTPLLTMGIISREARGKTDRLLYTSPVPLFQIVLGKYLSMLIVFLVPVAVYATYPLILSIYGKVYYGECATALLAYFLFGAAAVSIGLFISSFTENQIIAAVLTFAALFVTFLMGAITSMISQEGNLLTRVLSWVDMSKRMENLMSGILDIRGIVYYLSVVVLMLIFTSENIRRRRFSLNLGNIRLSVTSFAVVLVALGAAFGVNYLVLTLPDDVTKFDLTKNRLYTISDESKAFLKDLDRDVKILCMNTEDNTDELVKTTLTEYAGLSGHIEVKYVDMYKNPDLAADYTDEDVSEGDIIVFCDGRSKVISQSEMVETSMDYQTFSQTITGYDGEGQLASAIAYVTDGKETLVGYVTGHGEIEEESLTVLNKALKKENLTVKELNLLSVTKIEDVDVLFLLAPTFDYSAEEADKVKEYLKNGGCALIATQYSKKEGVLENFESILKEYGAGVTHGLIEEEAMDGFYGNNPMYLLPSVSETPMTKTVAEDKRYVFLPYAQALIKDEKLPEGTKIEDALMTSKSAVIEGEEKISVSAPFVTGAYITRDDTKIALLTSVMALTDDAATVVNDANVTMVTDAVSSMTGAVNPVYIPVKKTDMEYITVPRAFVILYSLVFSILLPLVIVASGIVIWVKRRRK